MHNGKGRVALPAPESTWGDGPYVVERLGKIKQTSWNSYSISLDIGVIF